MPSTPRLLLVHPNPSRCNCFSGFSNYSATEISIRDRAVLADLRELFMVTSSQADFPMLNHFHRYADCC